MKLTGKLIPAIILLGLGAQAQVNYSGGVYAQNFDAMPGTTNNSVNVAWTDNVTLPGWYASKTTFGVTDGTLGGTAASFDSTSSSADNVGLFSFGEAASTDRALGSRATSNGSGNDQILYGVRMINNTGQTLTRFTVTYTGEQWFKSSSGNAHSLLLDYQLAASGIAAGTWNSVAATFTSPIVGATPTALNGNLPENRAVKVAVVTGVTWAPGQELWLRIRDDNESGPEQGMAVDDFHFLADNETGLFFNGSSSYVTMGNGAASATAFGASDFTVECRFLRTGTGTAASSGAGGVLAVPLIAKGVAEADGDNRDGNYFLGIDASGRLAADFEQRNATDNGTAYNAGQNFPIIGSTVLQNGVWYHVAATYHTATATWKLYVNGVAETTSIPPGSPAAFVGVVPRNDSIQGLGIGTAIDSVGDPYGYFHGVIDEVRIWNLARTEAQILANKDVEIGSGQAGMLARFGLDEATGMTTAGSDAAGSPTLAGTLSGTPLPVWVNAKSFAVSSNLPPVVTATAPADEATGIGTSTTVSVNIADPENAATTVTFYGRKTTPLVPGADFTLIAIPDTQYYSENINEYPVPPGTGANISYFNAQTEWIRSNRDARNIAFVSHMGDMVQNGDFAGDPAEWIRADGAMKTIENQSTTLRAYGIPWGVAPGNHDIGTGDGTGTTVFYNQYFGTTRFAGRNYFGGNFGTNNNNNYQQFSASGLDFIIIHLEYNAGPLAGYQAVLDWADALMKAYPNRRAIVTSHYILNAGDPATFSPQGQNIYNELKDNPNFFLMLCGHIHGEGRRTDTFQSRNVHSILQDYQEGDNGGNGFLRTLKFSPATNLITAEMYSPTLDRLANSGDVSTTLGTFSLQYNMQSAITEWIPLGSVNVPANGTMASLSWTGLEAGSRYEWYASASDGISTGSGAIRRFASSAATSPTLSLTSPATGTSYVLPATVPLTATVSGQVTRVEFFGGTTKIGEDSTAPYQISWTNPPPGTHQLTAVATDSSGRSTLSNVVSITAVGVAPTITLTAPTNGGVATAPATINLAATAGDSDGSVVKVEFYQGEFKIGEDTTSPYTFDWTNVAPGTYSLSAVATDSSGISTASVIVGNVVSAGASSGTVVRGPYLQKAAPTQMTLCWRGSQSAVGRVRYGTSALNLDQFKDDASPPDSPFNHVVTLTGLTPGTTYYYSIGSASDTLASGVDYTFTTPPTAGTATNTRVWVLGDAGTATSGQAAVRDAFYNWTGARTPNLVLQLGDNAYENGSDAEFGAGMFNIYPTMLRKTPFWSCLGNHETAQATAFVDTYPYFDIYTFPIAGECGGVASGTEHYYSFNYGNIHFISLDSITASRAVDNPQTPTNEDGAMAAWLRADLASTTATWIICFFHHPPYTKGSHDSDTETELVEMRTNFLPILETGGVDLVLSGHSHCYERSYLLDKHYGLSTTLTPAMKKNSGDGRPAGNGAYIKPLTGPRDHFGAVYAVAGSAGKISGGPLNHPAHLISLNTLGSLVLDVNGTRLDATFLRENSSTPDTFTIIKQGAADSDGDGIPDEYELANGLNRFNSADAVLDSDGDGVSNLKEFIFSTASNVADRYAFSSSYNRLAGTNTVSFPSAVGRSYRVMYSGDLLSWQAATTAITGTGATMQWVDNGTTTGSAPSATSRRFYRIEVTVVP